MVVFIRACGFAEQVTGLGKGSRDNESLVQDGKTSCMAEHEACVAGVGGCRGCQLV